MYSYETVADWVTEQHDRYKNIPTYRPRLYEKSLWDFTATFDKHILYEDPDIAVINKPPFILSHYNSHNADSFGVEETAKFIWGDDVNLAHRLDRNTSGALILAKNFDSLINLQAQFGRRTAVPVQKHYLALLEGELNEPAEVKALLNYQGEMGFVITDTSEKDGTTRTSETIVKPINTHSNNGHSYTSALIQILTGRTHQIRIVTSHLGHPVIGDSMYNPNSQHKALRQLLHAWRIEFTHPTSKIKMEIEAPVPNDMVEWINEN